ncbi:manganese-dependent inorganic pyrophosphatase, partial [Arenimonas sp.]|nr:manganese-dependent inorganic pyrophosphatase [Candidatus Parcubacteria bacterium]
MIKVFGHKSPDTDATISAIVWAWYLNTYTATKAEAFVLGTLNKETQFVLNKWTTIEPALLESVNENDEVVIVDTNNAQELFDNINDTNIIQIIDHHILTGTLKSKKPVDIHIKPLASTATVIYNMLGNHVENLPDDIAGLILSSILSDTLAFRSPTTTSHDKAVAEKLAEKLSINIEEYSITMFNAKSDISDFTDVGLVHLDSKKNMIGDKNIRISVVETMNTQTVLDRLNGIIEAMKNILTEEIDTDAILFFITDILKEESTVIVY